MNNFYSPHVCEAVVVTENVLFNDNDSVYKIIFVYIIRHVNILYIFVFGSKICRMFFIGHERNKFVRMELYTNLTIQ